MPSPPKRCPFLFCGHSQLCSLQEEYCDLTTLKQRVKRVAASTNEAQTSGATGSQRRVFPQDGAFLLSRQLHPLVLLQLFQWLMHVDVQGRVQTCRISSGMVPGVRTMAASVKDPR